MLPSYNTVGNVSCSLEVVGCVRADKINHYNESLVRCCSLRGAS